jgi:putative membrane protein
VTAITDVLLLGQQSDGWDHHWWPLWLLVWAALAGAAFWLVARRRPRRPDPLDRARELLAERYARDELTGEQYRERIAELERSRGRQA